MIFLVVFRVKSTKLSYRFQSHAAGPKHIFADSFVRPKPKESDICLENNRRVKCEF